MSAPIWGTFAPLQIDQTETQITVQGSTFRYTFGKQHGLLISVRLLGREWLANRRPLPDLWTADAVHPQGREYEAARETEATVALTHTSPEQVTIKARGRYLNRSAAAFPLEYHLEYTIDADGVIRVEVENRGTGRGALRWLVFSKGVLPTSRVDFINHSEDLARVEARTGGYTSVPIPSEDGTVLSGQFYPWLQFGNDAACLDLTMDSADEISYGATDSMPYYDGLGNMGATCEIARTGNRISWDYYSIRNLYTPLRAGWKRKNRFFLSAVPAKPYNPALGDIRIHWIGPHQINPNFVYPTDDEIAEFARQGINILLGCAHWRSGEYSKPLEPRETRRVIRACHRHNLKIIPYLTFTDLNHQTAAFQRHGQDWQIEPVAEFKHLTNLMCYGAEGWREHWKKEVDTVLDRFDFDGLYIDFWVGKMACNNPRHGCDSRYSRYTLPGLREMALHAFQRVKEHSPDHFILSNTNMCAGAMINNLVDIRLPGEWGNIEETPPEVVRGYLNSRRLGCNSLLLGGSIPEFTLRSVSLSLRCQSPMTGWRRGPKERKLFMKYADILRSFGISRSRSLGAWEEDGSLSPTPKGMVTYWYRNERGALVVGVDTVERAGRKCIRIDKPSRLSLRPGKSYLLYRPDAGRLLSEKPVPFAKLKNLSADLKAWEPLLVFAMPAKNHPQILWATYSDDIEEERWNARQKKLRFSIKGAEGGETTVTLYPRTKAVAGITQNGHSLRYRKKDGLVTFQGTCNEGIEVAFAQAKK